ncbi:MULTISPECIES: VirB4 family type IV secretion system protein [Bacillus cereus group]|uniref:Helicase HerA central domain-containing protein n=1 Tax=Bacillus cereus (strain G9842) TaxID=405531 RepID=B7IYW7_BACC2|nr:MULTISPECIES: hypothetical protein [Bacillus cereus group]ACK98667.1 conserved hypothetical protein [Bacillus cereus G9842]MDR4137486.1 hypothetical protein [Bacillus cereus]MDR4367338.1 hypothetical protein [Bacillus cereus]PEE63365.1 hypothetical protein COM74_19860 [Bacillus thuringiensis]
MQLLKRRKKNKEVDVDNTGKEQEQIKEQDADKKNDFMDNVPTFIDLIAPDGIAIKSEDHGVIKQSLGTQTYFRPMYIPRDGYPRKLKTNWLNNILSMGEVDVVIDIHKVRKNEAIKRLQRQQTMFLSNLTWQNKKGNIDQINDLQTKIADCEMLMEEIQFGENDMFNVSSQVILYSNSLQNLNKSSEFLEDALSGFSIKLATAFSRIKKGYKSGLPFGKNYLSDSYRNIDRRALSTFAPYISGSGRYHGGIPYGINMITDQKEFINSFGNETYRPDNYNMGFFGVSGSGKSVGMKMKISREMPLANVYAGIIDPEGEFVKLTKILGGINLDVHEESGIIINPCAINYSEIPLDDKNDEELEMLAQDDKVVIYEKDGKKFQRFVPIREKTNEILDFFDIVVRGKGGIEDGLDVYERNYLEEAIMYIFTEELGITSHPDSLFKDGVEEVDGRLIQSQVRKPEPEILQIYNYILERYSDADDAKRLLHAIKPFLRTGSKPIFDGQTNLGSNVKQSLDESRLVNFNISQLEEGFLRPIAFHVILNYLWEYFAKNPKNSTKRKFIYCDEIWQFIDNEQTVTFFEKIARRIRKRHGGLCYASQDFVRLLRNAKSRGILTNTHTLLFLKQNKIDKEEVRRNFDITEGELNIIFGNPAKGEGVLKTGDSSIWLRTDPSDEELVFIESNPAVLEEKLKRQAIHSR